ncbi:aryl-hydrocarbon-interacting protein-like 1 [Anguilla rostrata]|uniref:aryl-hydrocarbon-interacting protein-like 1 n=1 Tax=Anguilla rostrata TaxID=7938 RepID=UPI0030D47772
MEEMYLLKHPGVKKKILHGGQGPIPHFPPGTKLVFHYQTLKDNFERTVIDDSRKNKQPVEIFVGKMFKLEVWEVLLTSMRIGEVAEFWCDAAHTGLYPMVAKGIRLAEQGRDPLEGQRHTCGMGNLFHYHSTGFPELDEIMKEPQPLIFIMELISVGDPFSYKRESWMMEKDEKLQAVPSLHLQGNALVKQARFREAASKYQEAVLLLKTVQSREMPGHEDYINLERLITPLVLNYCQCMLELQEYYTVLEQTTELLEKHKGNVKAYYKRAKAHAAVWNEKEARRDFLMVANLDVTLAPLVHRELKLLTERMKEKYWEEKNSYWGILEDKGGAKSGGKKGEGEEEESSVALEKEEESTADTDEDKGLAAEAANQESTGSQGTNRNAPPVTEGKDWQQMLRLIPLLQDEGNFLVKEKRYPEAVEKYKEALEYINFLQTHEVKQKGEDWESLEKVRLPLSLNLSQCMLELGEHRQVLEINGKLLKRHKDNLKALYQRARAHCALHQEEEARRDFSRVAKLDPKLKPVVRQELRKLGEAIRARQVQEKKNYWMAAKEKKSRGGSKGRKSEKSQGVEPGEGTQERESAAGLEDKDGKEALEEKVFSGEEVQTAGVQREEQEVPGGPARGEEDKASPGLDHISGVTETTSTESPGAGAEPAAEHAPAEQPANDGAVDKGEANEYAGNVAMPADPANGSPAGVQSLDNEGENGNAVTAEHD